MTPHRFISLPFLLVVVAIYALGQLTWYLDTPLGMSPVLDGRENLQIAAQIAEGTLPAEPFYRAMLYPALLAFLPFGHSFIGLICHLLNTALAAGIARRFWQDRLAGLVAGACVGLNPVLLHFAFDPLDTTLGITFFLSALLALLNLRQEKLTLSKGLLYSVSAGLALALATLTRPHFLLTTLVVLAIFGVALIRKKTCPIRFAAFLAALALPFAIFGFAHKSVAGTFAILPTQGAYNLYISNKPTANGLYFKQTLAFHNLGPHENPNRLEGDELYRRATGNVGTPQERSAYWRNRTIESVFENPFQWLKLEAFKAYAIFNSFEQYNNKTYSFHKELSPWLRYNPLNWGILFVAAVACGTLFWFRTHKDLLPGLIIAASIVAGLLIFMASARFRLPLVPLLAILAGGAPIAYASFARLSKGLRLRSAVATLLAAVIAFSAFGDIDSEETYLQDAVLIADAAARIGDDAASVKWASFALLRDPDHQQALRLRLISRYNQVASGTLSNSAAVWGELRENLEKIRLEDELLAFVRGVILWNTKERPEAIEVWKSGYATYGPSASACLAALVYVGSPIEELGLPVSKEAYIIEGEHFLYGFALAEALPPPARPSYTTLIGLSPERYMAIGQSFERILPR